MRLAGQGERALLDKFIMQISSAKSYIHFAGRFTLQAANIVCSETIVVKCLQHLSSRQKLACSKKSRTWPIRSDIFDVEIIALEVGEKSIMYITWRCKTAELTEPCLHEENQNNPIQV